jgi:hypothetical protein
MTTQTTTKNIPAIRADINSTTLHLMFADGTSIVIDSGELNADILQQATMHGLKQKLVDAAAMSKGATIDEKYEAVLDVAERLRAGEWNKKREAGEGGGNGGLLFRALCELSPAKSPDSIRAFLAEKSNEQKSAMRAVPRVAAAIDRLRASKVNAEDGESLLADFV